VQDSISGSGLVSEFLPTFNKFLFRLRGNKMSQSMKSLLEDLQNSKTEVRLYLTSGLSLKGQIEKSADWIETRPFVLRSTDAISSNQRHVFFAESVVSLSFEESASLERLFSKAQQERKSQPAPSLLEQKRHLSEVAKSLTPLQIDLKAQEMPDNEMRWRLSDLLAALIPAIKSIQNDSLGRSEINQKPSLTLTPSNGAALEFQAQDSYWLLTFDLGSAEQARFYTTEHLTQIIEKQL
jgi:hypothetical protein